MAGGGNAELASALFLCILAVLSGAAFWIIGGMKIISALILVARHMGEGPRSLPEISDLIRNKEYDQALLKLAPLERKYPSNEPVLMALMNIYLKTGKKKKALDKISRLCKVVEHPMGKALLAGKAKPLDMVFYQNLKRVHKLK